jgi:hypothetical protein
LGSNHRVRLTVEKLIFINVFGSDTYETAPWISKNKRSTL